MLPRKHQRSTADLARGKPFAYPYADASVALSTSSGHQSSEFQPDCRLGDTASWICALYDLQCRRHILGKFDPDPDAIYSGGGRIRFSGNLLSMADVVRSEDTRIDDVTGT